MESLSRVLVFSAVAVVFFALLAWYSNDYIHYRELPDWPDSEAIEQKSLMLRGATEYLESLDSEVLVFIYSPSFRDGYTVRVELSSRLSGVVTASIWTANDRKRRMYTGMASRQEIDVLFEVLGSVHFWRTPPGEFGAACTDGDGAAIISNLGGGHRIWSNACELSDNMDTIRRHFDEVVGGLRQNGAIEAIWPRPPRR